MEQKKTIALFKKAHELADYTTDLFANGEYQKAVENFSITAQAIEAISKTEIFAGKYAAEFNHWLGMMVSFVSSGKMKGAYDVIAQKLTPMLKDMLMDAIIVEGMKEYSNPNEMDGLTKKVQDQYKKYMYPNKWKGIVPKGYKKKYKDAVVSPWYNLNHMQNMCRQKPKKISDLSVLVAGCGTGEDALACAFQYSGADFTFVDISPSSLAMAKYYGSELGVKNVEYRLDNIMTMELHKTYDIIISVGVIHHLSEPHLGVESLNRHLKDDGIMAIMVYGEYGRFEIGLFQRALQVMNKDQDGFDFGISAVPEILQNLHDCSRLHDLMWKNDVFKGDQHVVDLLLNVNENRYNVMSLKKMMGDGGMRICEFPWFDLYNPLNYSKASSIRQAISNLDFIEKAYLAELLHGKITKHTIYAVKQENRFNALSASHKNWMDYVPVKSEFLVTEESVIGSRDSKYTAYFNKNADLDNEQIETLKLNLDEAAWNILKACNGKRTVRDIIKHLSLREGQVNAEMFQQMIDLRMLHLHQK